MAKTVQSILRKAKANRQFVGVTFQYDLGFGKDYTAQVQNVSGTQVKLFLMHGDRRAEHSCHKNTIRQVRSNGEVRNTRARIS